jgi:hypothetical protein
MKTVVWLAVVLALALASAAAWAQPEERQIYRLKTVIEIDPATFEVGCPGPVAPFWNVRLPSEFGKRIELKTSFQKEILKSIDKL